MKVSEDIFLPGQTKNADFERAEEKAIKAIQLHGMNIGGKEKNPQIDEAYLLLGQARYFDNRFVPAMAAFNNILNKIGFIGIENKPQTFGVATIYTATK